MEARPMSRANPALLGTTPTLRRYDAKPSADVAQLVERVHGKDEVSGSTPDVGSLISLPRHRNEGDGQPLLFSELESGCLPKRWL
jgi:hypothetical protein